jgi:hypothetical protein
MKHTRQGYGLSSWVNGSDYYTACLQYRITLPLTPGANEQMVFGTKWSEQMVLDTKWTIGV